MILVAPERIGAQLLPASRRSVQQPSPFGDGMEEQGIRMVEHRQVEAPAGETGLERRQDACLPIVAVGNFGQEDGQIEVTLRMDGAGDGRSELDDELDAIRVRDVAQPVAAGPPSLPVYHGTILAIQEHLADLPPWLALAGNYLGRLGVARLLELSREAAARVIARQAEPPRRVSDPGVSGGASIG